MEPTCDGCGRRLSELQMYWTLESKVSGRYKWHSVPGPIYCEECMTKMVALLKLDFEIAASEEEG